MHHNKPEVAADATLDDVYIPPPDYSDSDNLMALQSGIFVRRMFLYSVIR